MDSWFGLRPSHEITRHFVNQQVMIQALSRELYKGNHHVMIRRELCTKWKPHHEKWLYFRDIYSSRVTVQHKTFTELLQAQFPRTAKPNRLLSNHYGEQHGFRSNGFTFLASMVSLAKLRRGTTALWIIRSGFSECLRMCITACDLII